MRLCNVGSCHDCIFAAAGSGGSGGSGGSALDASLCYPTSMSSLEASLKHPPSLATVRMHSHSKVQVYTDMPGASIGFNEVAEEGSRRARWSGAQKNIQEVVIGAPRAAPAYPP